MKIGVSMFLTEKTGNAGAIAREAENLGFESFWVAEHLVMPVTYATWYPRGKDGKVPEFYASLIDPFIALATAAAATTTIKLGTGICLLPERNVIETAKAVASLDLYSGGRFIFGVGAGWFPEEAAIMGVDFKRRWLHLRESIEALRELWTKDEASYSGEIIKFPPVKLYPKPVQKPARRLFWARTIRNMRCDGSPVMPTAGVPADWHRKRPANISRRFVRWRGRSDATRTSSNFRCCRWR
jgi:probable F420-dependent oxidoreductase